MLSVFDIFKIGIGPSSSHTVGPMRAARQFVRMLDLEGLLLRTVQIRTDLYGSLGATGRGHATDLGVILGLLGETPDAVDPATVTPKLAEVRRSGQLRLLDRHPVAFRRENDIVFRAAESLPEHSNGIRFVALAADSTVLAERIFFSVGGGFVVERGVDDVATNVETSVPVWPHPFRTGSDLIAWAGSSGRPITGVVFANECVWRSETDVRPGLLEIWSVMRQCVQHGFGIDNDGAAEPLPGPLHIRRRAPGVYRELRTCNGAADGADPLAAMDWVNAFAMAVNEDNAARGRVVTAPTNGAAGVIPAVLHYYAKFVPDASDDGVVTFLLTAAAIGMLYKAHASISGAEVGLSGRSRCGLLDGRRRLGGCARRHAGADRERRRDRDGAQSRPHLRSGRRSGADSVHRARRDGSDEAINAARMPLHGDGKHYVSFDAVIKTMLQATT